MSCIIRSALSRLLFDKLKHCRPSLSNQSLCVKMSMTQKTDNEEEIKKVCKSNIGTEPDSMRDNRLAVCLVRKSKSHVQIKHVQATLHCASFKAEHRLIHDPRTPYMHAKISKRKKEKKAIKFKKKGRVNAKCKHHATKKKKKKKKKKSHIDTNNKKENTIMTSRRACP